MTEDTDESGFGGIPAAQVGATDLAESFEIERSSGIVKAKAHHFGALFGWEIRRQYRDYVESNDTSFRVRFTISVLSHVSIMDGDREVYLSDQIDIDKHLESWQNVEKAFNAVLGYNGIKTDAAESERRRWQVAGEDMAASFLAAVSSIIGPALNIATNQKGEP